MDGQVGTRRTKGPGWASASTLVMALIVMTAGLVALLPPGIGRAFPSGPAGTIATYGSSVLIPAGVAVDGAGNLYVAEDGPCQLVQIKPPAAPTTLIGGCGPPPQLKSPGGVAVNATTVFVADSANCVVESVPIPGGVPSIVAGNGTCGYAGDGGPATSAELNGPEGVAVDSLGNLYIADTNNCRIREVDAVTRIITTVAGNGTCNGPTLAVGQAIGPGVPIGPPVDVAVYGSTQYVITGAMNGVCQEFGINAGVVAAPAYTDASCLMFAGNHVAVSGSGSVYASFADNTGCEVKTVPSNNVAIIVAGMATCGYSGDGGPATSAEIGSTVGGLTTDGAGNLYISDRANNVIRIVYAPVLCGASGTDPDGNCDTDFSNPGPAQPCIQDHIGDANGDGYSDSDELTPHVVFMCTGAYPLGGGLGLAGLSSATIDGPCPGRPPASLGAKIARADVNVDGVVNIFDLSAVAGVYGQSGFASNPYDKRNEFDENGDGVINIFDLSIVASVYGKAVPAC